MEVKKRFEGTDEKVIPLENTVAEVVVDNAVTNFIKMFRTSSDKKGGLSRFCLVVKCTWTWRLPIKYLSKSA